MRYVWLALALLVGVVGVLCGRLLGLSRDATATLAVVSTFLALFPFMKPWMPKMKFAYWALAAAISTAVAWLFYLGFSRFGS